MPITMKNISNMTYRNVSERRFNVNLADDVEPGGTFTIDTGDVEKDELIARGLESRFVPGKPGEKMYERV
jgi:hypothetical protein